MKIFKGKNSRGQSTVEFAFVFPALMVLFFALAGLTTIGYNWLVLQYAASEGSRFGSLGKIDPGDTTREQSITDRILEITSNLGVQGVTVTFADSEGNPTAASSSEFFHVTLARTLEIPAVLRVLFSFAQVTEGVPTYQVRANTVIRNEPF